MELVRENQKKRTANMHAVKININKRLGYPYIDFIFLTLNIKSRENFKINSIFLLIIVYVLVFLFIFYIVIDK